SEDLAGRCGKRLPVFATGIPRAHGLELERAMQPAAPLETARRRVADQASPLRADVSDRFPPGHAGNARPLDTGQRPNGSRSRSSEAPSGVSHKLGDRSVETFV